MFLSTVVATQLDKNLSGRLTWNVGSITSINSSLVWDKQNHHVSASFQVSFQAYVIMYYKGTILNVIAKFLY